MPLDHATILAKARHCLAIEREALEATAKGLDRHFVAAVRAVEALKIFQQLKISDLFAVDAKGRPAGYIDVQDLPKLRIL